MTIERHRPTRARSGRRSAPPTGPSRSTSTSPSPATRSLITGWLRSFAGSRRPDRPARRRRLRHQEARHDLLHGRAGDLRVPRRGSPTSPTRSGWSSLPEVHDRYPTHERLSAHGFWTYDFVLPGLLLHAFETGDAGRLGRAPRRDRPTGSSPPSTATTGSRFARISTGSSTPAEMIALADSRRAARRQRQPDPVRRPRRTRSTSTSSTARTTRRSAATTSGISRRARSSCSREGVPQIYYVGLLAGENDVVAVGRTGEGRAINRHDYTCRRDRGGTPTPGRRSHPRAHPPAEHAPGLRRRAPSGPRCRVVTSHGVGRRRGDLRTRSRLGYGPRDRR